MKSLLSLVFVFGVVAGPQAQASGCDSRVQAAPVKLVSQKQVTGEFTCSPYPSSTWSYCSFTRADHQIPVLLNQAVEDSQLPVTQKPVTVIVEKYEAFLFDFCGYDEEPTPVPPANGYYYKLTVGGVDYTATESM